MVAMEDKNPNKMEIVQKPEWFALTVVKTAAFYAATFAAVYAIGSKIPGLNKFLWTQGAKEEAVSGAIVGSIVGTAYGFLQGAGNHAKYPLEVENNQLRNQVRQLKNDKSFAQQVVQDKLEPQPKTLG